MNLRLLLIKGSKIANAKKWLFYKQFIIEEVTSKEDTGLSPRELAKKLPRVSLLKCMRMMAALNKGGQLVHKWSPCRGDHASQESRYWIKPPQEDSNV